MNIETAAFIEDFSYLLCTSVNIPTGCSRMHMDPPTG